MTKTLQQIQEENRRLIILTCNPEAKSYEEALCLLAKSKGWQGDEFDKGHLNIFEELTLDRVLLAITSDNSKIAAYFQNHPQIIDIKQHNQDDWDKIDLSFRWVLTHKTLEEQTEHSQKVINKILMGNE